MKRPESFHDELCRLAAAIYEALVLHD
ncbi:protein YrbN [Rosenbergiella epipactidis]|nr:protein YrbN [Rosenbergiella epipactidis]